MLFVGKDKKIGRLKLIFYILNSLTIDLHSYPLLDGFVPTLIKLVAIKFCLRRSADGELCLV